MPSSVVQLTVLENACALCRKPYPDHPQGCPNYGVKAGCPPHVTRIEKKLDLSQPVYAIWTTFDLAGHVARMRERHPDWSWRQLVCCLYWQRGARQALSLAVAKFREAHPGLLVTRVPEALGVNVTATMAGIGEQLEWPPRAKAYQVAVAGSVKA